MQEPCSMHSDHRKQRILHDTVTAEGNKHL